MKHKMKIDAIDSKILEILQANSKITNSDLAKRIGLSPAPTLERVKKLETSGVIKSYHAKLNYDLLGLKITTFVQVSLSNHKVSQINEFVKKVTSLSEVVECHHITGSGDFLIKILVEDIQAYHKLVLEKLSKIEEIGNMSTMIALNTYKENSVVSK